MLVPDRLTVKVTVKVCVAAASALRINSLAAVFEGAAVYKRERLGGFVFGWIKFVNRFALD